MVETKCDLCGNTLPVELAFMIDGILEDREQGLTLSRFVCDGCSAELEDLY